MKRFTFLPAVLIALSSLAVTGCNSPRGLTEDQGALVGAGTGAVAGSVVGDGGIILPALGAVGGAVVGEGAAENDAIFD